jgi:hypothetical protein
MRATRKRSFMVVEEWKLKNIGMTFGFDAPIGHTWAEERSCGVYLLTCCDQHLKDRERRKKVLKHDLARLLLAILSSAGRWKESMVVKEEEEDKLYWHGPTIGTTSLLRTNM